jgi:hypothetical protein
MFHFRREIYGRFTPTEAADDETLYSVTGQKEKITYSYRNFLIINSF